MIERREVLKFALGGLALGQAVGARTIFDSAAAQPASPQRPSASQYFALSQPTPFDPAAVTEEARRLAKQPFKAPAADVPDPFRNLSYEQYVAIRHRPEAAIWVSDNLGFAVELLHRGFIFSTPMDINLVAEGASRRVVYDAALFDFGKLSQPINVGDIGFSGFRILAPQGGENFLELAAFQGASFFRALARGQNLGAMARALSIKTADPRGEEFPAFRSVWIERPTLAANALVIHALIDSESVTGAFRFTIHPVEATIIDVECTLFARVAVDNFGVATISATHLTGAIDDRRRADDLRPTVSEVLGVQMLTGKGEWLWRPVSNRDTLQISTFVDENPRGFGLLQRDRNFDHYQDDDQHWEARPSVWIEPLGDWSVGGVQLIEIPSDSEANDNIIVYWKPRQPLVAGGETSFAYRQFWCWSPPERPSLAAVAQSRVGRGSSAKRRRFLVEFTGDNLAAAQGMDGFKPSLSVAPGAIVSMRTFASPDKTSYRVLFELDFGGEPSSELRLALETAAGPVSETWIYRWTP
ncbi:glucan biosynthesis protein [Methylocapsa acidiphila]|uniref:glucan biosynthesis protein n=1 Tax=Methylocapsa acidiphila TaxID=133552 RepID=UPI0004154445|nr:glucan biosynthesis protein [Methylocapsa acidiphila]